MKQISRSKKSFLWQAVLASTFFSGFPIAAQAVLTAINADTTTAATPDTGGGAGGLGGYDIIAANKTLSVTNGYIIGRTPDAAGGTSVDNNSTGAAFAGTVLEFLGSSIVQGEIGSTNSLNIIKLNGAGIVQFNGNVTAATTNIANNGTATYSDNVIVTGDIDNTSGVVNQGTVNFLGSGQVTGNIGNTNSLLLLNLNTALGANETIELNGAVVNAATINVNDDGATPTTLTLNNAAMVLTSNITTTANDLTVLNVLNASLITGQIGAAGNEFDLMQVGQNNDLTVDGDIFANNVQFQGNNSLILLDGSDVTDIIDSTAANQGILELQGSHTITGDIGAVNSLNTINVTGAGGIINLQGTTINSSSINYDGLANSATTINLADGVAVTGNITNTTGTANVGTLNFVGTGTVNGTIGQANPVNSLYQINLQGAAGKIVTFQDDVQVGTGNINFLQDSQLNIADNADVTGNIDTDAANQGTVNYLGNSIVNGTLGVSNDLKLVQLSGALSNVNFNQNVNTNELRFANNNTASIASGVSISGPITTTMNDQGTLNLLGNFTIDQPIGQPGFALNSVIASGPAGATVTLVEDIFATNTLVNGGGTLFALEPHTINGNLSLSLNSTLSVASAGAPLTVTGDLTINPGSTLQIDLNKFDIPTYIQVNDQAFIDANTTLVLTNTPQAFVAGVSDIKLVDATNLGNIQVPQNVVGDSLLLQFEVEAQNAPNNDLLLHIEALPVSLFADRPNTIPIAGALDAMAGQDFLGSLQNLLDQLPYFTTKEQLNDALAALAPIVDGSYTQEVFAAQLLGYGAVSDRIRYLRQRKNVPVVGKGFESGLSSGDDWDDNGHGRWFKLYGQYSDQGTRDSVAGYNSETWGVAIGSDVSLNDLNLIGVSANLSHTYVGHDVSNSKSSIYSLQAAIYGEQDFCDWWYFNWVTSVAYNKYTTERNFVFGLLPLSPQADFVGWQFGTKGELGYEYLYRNWHIIPNTSLYFSHLALNGYNESGAGTASQNVDSHSYNMLKAGAGVRAAYRCPMEMPYRIRPIIFQPEVRMNAFYDFINDNMETTSNFTGGGPSFTTLGAVPAASSFNLGASLSVFSDYNDYIVTISYDYETKRDYNANAGFVRLRYEW
ncbi:autotransporter domain-containing protein [Candidatus Berkiella aquae]|uniref:Autotransporter domain-containing protein n=1 Tax=Candidatus Berkiella aquae TaxID=295108 RepID=A0A0Q9YI89_9GAMM|nr:autotransporter domain-containing protein [Candidatus Berkiella aquae]MCS5712268.1 autotransporter domain-containing protein [Candidatus Berkiella aquae]